jgi:hypothetical protein
MNVISKTKAKKNLPFASINGACSILEISEDSLPFESVEQRIPFLCESIRKIVQNYVTF